MILNIYVKHKYIYALTSWRMNLKKWNVKKLWLDYMFLAMRLDVLRRPCISRWPVLFLSFTSHLPLTPGLTPWPDPQDSSPCWQQSTAPSPGQRLVIAWQPTNSKCQSWIPVTTGNGRHTYSSNIWEIFRRSDYWSNSRGEAFSTTSDVSQKEIMIITKPWCCFDLF